MFFSCVRARVFIGLFECAFYLFSFLYSRACTLCCESFYVFRLFVTVKCYKLVISYCINNNTFMYIQGSVYGKYTFAARG